jgi:hypothetical protein
MKPPKCSTCQKEEWGHTCGPVAKLASKAKPKRKRRKYAREYYDRVRRKKLGHSKRVVESVENASRKTHDP